MLIGYSVQAYIDGGFLRSLGESVSKPLPYPHLVCEKILDSPECRAFFDGNGTALHRINFYDALPRDESDTAGAELVPAKKLESYWNAIELIWRVRMGWGFLRRESKKRTQKGVDVLLTTEMLTGAVDDSYDVALLIAADGDFVPLLEEVRRRGKQVILSAREKGLPGVSVELRRSCDLFVDIRDEWLQSLDV